MRLALPRSCLVFLALCQAGCAPGPSSPGEVFVFAAASLEESLREAGDAFERSGGARTVFNFAGSDTLARQIEAGARGDLFLSADEGSMDSVERAGRLEPGTRAPFLGNTLVVVVRRDSPLAFRTLEALAEAPIRGLAVGDPESVPAGRYARAALGPLWDSVAPRVVPALDARAARALVESDPDVAGIVYRTDAAASERLRVLLEIPPGDAPPIRYAAAVLIGAPNPEGGRRFLAFLRGEEGRALFRRHGFLPPPEGP